MDPLLIENLRRDYRSSQLIETEVSQNPLVVFEQWFSEALASGLHEPNAMTLATAGLDQGPSARIVLMKGFSDQGFVFYSNYESMKGKEIANHDQVALVFYWGELERQIRIKGRAHRLGEEQSTAYFNARPRASQLGAVVSPQSQPIGGREELERKWAEADLAYPEGPIPKPAYWGGFQVVPSEIEFWQGRTSRLHDRLMYSRKGREGTSWQMTRLAP